MPPSPIPDAYRTATPYLIVNDAAAAIAFYKDAFGATELVRLADPTGKVMHAEIRINNSPFMLADEFPDMGYRSPLTLGGSPVSIYQHTGLRPAFLWPTSWAASRPGRAAPAAASGCHSWGTS